ncbi:MAG TPA: site-specific integrase, partial [Telmatospirillum sp.]|nr:site-specific integrase [Telmatospirillum sp.]
MGSDASRHVESFLEMMAAERGAAANTLDAYRRDLADFADCLTALGLSVHQADSAALRDYIGQMKRRGLAARTAARRLSTLRQFHQFLFAEGVRDDDPSQVIDAPRLGRPLPKYLSEAEVDALIQTARRKDDAAGRRIQALVELLYATGLR